jgi:hypothetical protein
MFFVFNFYTSEKKKFLTLILPLFKLVSISATILFSTFICFVIWNYSNHHILMIRNMWFECDSTTINGKFIKLIPKKQQDQQTNCRTTEQCHRVSRVEQGLLTLPEYLSSLSVFTGVRVARSLVLCVCFVDNCLSFSFLNGVSSVIYGFWLPPVDTKEVIRIRKSQTTHRPQEVIRIRKSQTTHRPQEVIRIRKSHIIKHDVQRFREVASVCI